MSNYTDWKGDERRARYSLDELKELIKKSTKVVNWYAHGYDGQEGFSASVRGPFNRWFKVSTVSEDYKKDVAYAGDDAEYCAAAMNSLPFLVDRIEKTDSIFEALKRDIRNVREDIIAEIERRSKLTNQPQLGKRRAVARLDEVLKKYEEL